MKKQQENRNKNQKYINESVLKALAIIQKCLASKNAKEENNNINILDEFFKKLKKEVSDEVYKAILSKKVAISSNNQKQEYTLLTYAMHHGAAKIVGVLCKNGADVNQKATIKVNNQDGVLVVVTVSPLMFAIHLGSGSAGFDIVKTLLHYGANPDEEFIDEHSLKMTPFLAVIQEKTHELYKLFLEFVNPVSYTQEKKLTLLLVAFNTHNLSLLIEIIKIFKIDLLDDFNIKSLGSTPILAQEQMAMSQVKQQSTLPDNMVCVLFGIMCYFDFSQLKQILKELGKTVADYPILMLFYIYENSYQKLRQLLEEPDMAKQIDYRFSFKHKDFNGFNALMVAASLGYYPCVSLLIEFGADVNSFCDSELTFGYENLLTNKFSKKMTKIRRYVLGIALKSSFRQLIVPLLLEKGADVDAVAELKNGVFFSFFNEAISMQDMPLINKMLQYSRFQKENKNVPANIRVARAQRIFFAGKKNLQDIFNLFLKSGIGINESINAVILPQKKLLAFLIESQTDIYYIKALLDNGADPVGGENQGSNLENSLAVTCCPLFLAIRYSSYEVVKLLLDAGVAIDSLAFLEDIGEITPLIYAILVRPEYIKKLLQEGARADFKMTKGPFINNTPIQLAMLLCPENPSAFIAILEYFKVDSAVIHALYEGRSLENLFLSFKDKLELFINDYQTLFAENLVEYPTKKPSFFEEKKENYADIIHKKPLIGDEFLSSFRQVNYDISNVYLGYALDALQKIQKILLVESPDKEIENFYFIAYYILRAYEAILQHSKDNPGQIFIREDVVFNVRNIIMHAFFALDPKTIFMFSKQTVFLLADSVKEYILNDKLNEVSSQIEATDFYQQYQRLLVENVESQLSFSELLDLLNKKMHELCQLSSGRMRYTLALFPELKIKAKMLLSVIGQYYRKIKMLKKNENMATVLKDIFQLELSSAIKLASFLEDCITVRNVVAHEFPLLESKQIMSDDCINIPVILKKSAVLRKIALSCNPQQMNDELGEMRIANLL